MAETVDDVRTCHSTGHTVACYYGKSREIITGGIDGELHLYPGIYEDESAITNCNEKIKSIDSQGDILIVANGGNEVKSYTLPNLTVDRTLVRFPAPVNHICLSQDGSLLAACSSDFSIKVVDINGTTQKTLTGHEAPVMSCAFSPDGKLLASSSCDGTVQIWNIEEQRSINKLSVLKKCNDIENYQGLCRISWHDKSLAIPVEKSVKIFSTESWKESTTIPVEHTGDVSFAIFSSCGAYLFTATINGEIYVWDLRTKSSVKKFIHYQAKSITSLVQNKGLSTELLFSDDEGQCGLLEVPCASKKANTATKPVQNMIEMEDFDDDDILLGTAQIRDGLDDDDDDEDILGTSRAKQRKRSHVHEPDDADEEDEDMINGSAKKRTRVNNMDNFLDDEAGEDDDHDDDDDPNISLNLLKEGFLPKEPINHMPVIDENDDSMSEFIVEDKSKESKVPTTASAGPPLFVQKPFQPSSTPAHLMHRFMVWNSIGIIRCHSEDDVSSIDVEFHDTTTHHPLHLPNQLGHHLAALSSTAAVLACESDDDIPSKLTCLHFGSWDTNKEWSLSMPAGEEIKSLCVNASYIALATSQNFVRILSVGGMQTQIFRLAGPVVSMAMHDKQLYIVYHKAAGLTKSQSLGVQLYEIKNRNWKLMSDEMLPVKSESSVVWLGFSAEGSPAFVDSTGDICLLMRSHGNLWTPIGNTKSAVKSKSDNYWVIGIEEQNKRVRCILCKGSNFPTTLPRPIPTTIPFQIPICEAQTDKAKIEHDILQTRLLSNNSSYNRRFTAFDDVDEGENEKVQVQLLMKLFALACKSDRDFRAMEICKLMPNTQAIVLAINYATRTKKMNLARRLDQLAREKDAEENEQDEDEEDIEEEEEDAILSDDELFPEKTTNFTTNQEKRGSNGPIRLSLGSRSEVNNKQSASEHQDATDEEEDEDDDIDMEILKDIDEDPSTYNSIQADSQVGDSQKSLTLSQPRNPFKVQKTGGSANSSRGVQHFEQLKSKKMEKTKSGSKISPGVKEGTGKSKDNKKSKTISFSKKKTVSNGKVPTKKDDANKDKSKTGATRKSGFQLFLDSKSVEGEDSEMAVHDATMAWKNLPKEEKEEWNVKAKSSCPEKRNKVDSSSILKERNQKTEESENIEPTKTKPVVTHDTKPKKAVDTSASKSKLSAFSFQKT